jgi:hypothetical protein
MAYGNGNGAQNKFVAKKPPQAPATTSAPAAAAAGRSEDAPKERTSYFKVFANKSGNGYSTILKEDVTIPAGTKVAIFEDQLTGKDGTVYQVLNVKRMTVNS